MRRFTTFALAIVVLAAGASHASQRERAGSGTKTNDESSSAPASEDSATVSTSASMFTGPGELKAAMVRQGISLNSIDQTLQRINSFATAYVRAVEIGAPMVQRYPLEELVEIKLVPALQRSTPELVYHPETGTVEVHAAEELWSKMDPNTQNQVRMTAELAVDGLLNATSSFGAQDKGRKQ